MEARRTYKGPSYYYMVVEYKGESGNICNSNIAVPFKVVSLCKVGMLIRCYVKDDMCFVDTNNIVELVKKEN